MPQLVYNKVYCGFSSRTFIILNNSLTREKVTGDICELIGTDVIEVIQYGLRLGMSRWKGEPAKSWRDMSEELRMTILGSHWQTGGIKYPTEVQYGLTMQLNY